MALFDFEIPSVRLNRLRTQFDSTSQSMGDTVTDLVDLEARRRAMEDNLRRFREVEQRQQPPARPGPFGTPTATPTPSFDPVQAELSRRAGIQTSPIPAEPTGQPSGLDIAGRALSAIPSSPNELATQLAQRLTGTGIPARGIEEFETRVAQPFGAAALQIAESPAGGGLLGITELKGLQRRTEELGVPEELSPLPRERTFAEALEGGFVDPFKALVGDKEEQEKAVAVLEEAGLPRALAAQILADPTNLLPGIGFTKVDDFARLLRLATRATGRGRQAAVTALRNSDVLQQARRGIQEGEAGARPLRGGQGTVPQRIHKLHNRLARDFDLERLDPEVLIPEDVVPIAKQRTIAEFGEDPTITLYRGIGPGERQPAFGTREGVGEFWSTNPDRAAGFARGGKIFRVDVKASELVNPVGTPGPVGVRATRAGDEFVLPLEIQNRATELPAAPLRGGEAAGRELPGGSIAETSDEAVTHIAKGDPGPPPQEPPRGPPKAPRGPSPDDPQFDDILDAAIKGDPPDQALMRRHQGVIDARASQFAVEVTENNKELVRVGLGRPFRGSVVAKEEGSFNELNSLLHNPGAVARGERTVPDELRPIYDKLRSQTDFEQGARIDFDPDQALVEDYFFRGWKPPEGMFTATPQRGSLGRNPQFKLPRVDATYDEMFEAGFRPMFENPAEQARHSQLMGMRYREQSRLVAKMQASELALPVKGGPIPEGWRVPEVGPAFQGKPYAEGTNVSYTRQWAVTDEMANRLENIYGKMPKLGKGKAFGKTVEFNKVVNALTFIPKRAKLVGSVFQHLDFLQRSGSGAFSGFADALRRGQPIDAVMHLAKWPKSAVDIAHAVLSPGARARLAKLAIDPKPLWKNRKISNLMLREEGLSIRDPTLGIDVDDVIRQVRQEPKIVKLGKAPLRLLDAFERQWRQGLFQGMYPSAILSDVKNNIGPMVLRQHPEATDRQLAGMIATAANKLYSVIPESQSVIQNQQARFWLTRALFSLGENEGLLRSFTGAIRGPNAALFRTRLVGTYFALMTLASTIHFASTGKPLPLDRFVPVSKDKFGPLPFGYNTDFAAPTLPIKGRGDTEITLDLVMQQDTIFRILDPKSFLNARFSVPVSSGRNQLTGTDFFGAPIDTVGPGGIFSRTSQLVQDMFAPIGAGQAGLEIFRNNVEESEGLITPGEGRLGTAGLGLQAGGINLRVERTPELLDRVRGEVIADRGIKDDEGQLLTYDFITANDFTLKNDIDTEVEERIGAELEIRGETSKLRGQQTRQAEGFEALEATRERQQADQLTDDTKLNSNQWSGDVWREKYADRQRDFFAKREQIKEDFQITFDERQSPPKSVNAAIDTYFDVNVDDFAQADGTIDWDGFFDARDAALSPLSATDRTRVEQWLRKFDTPTVTEFRKAQDVMDRFFEEPKYVGLSLKQGKEVDRVLFEMAPALQTRFEAETGESLTRRNAVRHLAAIIRDKEAREFLLEHFGGGAQTGLRRIGAGTGLRRITDVRRETDEIRNEKRDQILIDNEVILARFYPDVLERELSREQEIGLLPSTLEALFGPAMTLPDIERRGLRRITAGR